VPCNYRSADVKVMALLTLTAVATSFFPLLAAAVLCRAAEGEAL